MLVLSRHETETVVIPGLDITIQIVSIKGKTVRVGIDAPREIKVLRGEVTDDHRDTTAQPASTRCRSEHDRVDSDAETETESSCRPLDRYLSKTKRAATVRESSVAYRLNNRQDDSIFDCTETVAC